MKLARAFDDLGVIRQTVSDDGILFHASVLADRTRPMTKLFAEVLTRPLFVDRDINFVREEQLSTIGLYETDPDLISLRVFRQVVFGKDHILGYVVSGTTAYGTVTVEPMLTLSSDPLEAMDGPQPSKTIPPHFSQVSTASEEDIQKILER